MSWESQGIALLSASLARPFVLAAAAWVILRAFRVRHPASRHAVWSVVLAGLLVLPLLSVTAPHWKLPVLAGDGASPASAPEPLRTVEPVKAVPVASPTRAIGKPQTGTEPRTGFTMPSIRTLALGCYLAGLIAMVLYRAVGWVMLRRVVSRSTPLKGQPLRESGDLAAPAAVGVLRPAVLLPVGWRDWNPDTRRAVLAHEFAHIRRNDALIAALGRLVKSVLWFHPLAWWVSRKVSELAELACDAVALESIGDPAGYSRILLEFADQVNRAGYRAALPGLAMADSSSRMGARIDQVFELANGNFRKLAQPGAWLVLVGLPVMGMAATVGLGRLNARPSPVQIALPIVFPKAQPAPVAAHVLAQAGPPPVRPRPPSPQPQGPQPQGPVSRNQSPAAVPSMVMVRARVVDQNGAFVDGLPQSAFRVVENTSVQLVTVFREEEVPLSMGLVVDDSGSMRDKRAILTAAAKALVHLSDPQDEMFIVHFSDRAYVDQDWTNDEAKLGAALNVVNARGGSSLRDAVSLAIDKARTGGKNENKVLFLITDGDDNTSAISQLELSYKAQQSGVVIYCIGLVNDPRASVNVRISQSSLNLIAKTSGGQADYPRDSSELDRIAAQVMHSGRSQYVLGYLPADPALDVASRRTRVVVNRPDLTIRIEPRP